MDRMAAEQQFGREQRSVGRAHQQNFVRRHGQKLLELRSLFRACGISGEFPLPLHAKRLGKAMQRRDVAGRQAPSPLFFAAPAFALTGFGGPKSLPPCEGSGAPKNAGTWRKPLGRPERPPDTPHEACPLPRGARGRGASRRSTAAISVPGSALPGTRLVASPSPAELPAEGWPAPLNQNPAASGGVFKFAQQRARCPRYCPSPGLLPNNPPKLPPNGDGALAPVAPAQASAMASFWAALPSSAPRASSSRSSSPASWPSSSSSSCAPALRAAPSISSPSTSCVFSP